MTVFDCFRRRIITTGACIGDGVGVIGGGGGGVGNRDSVDDVDCDDGETGRGGGGGGVGAGVGGLISRSASSTSIKYPTCVSQHGLNTANMHNIMAASGNDASVTANSIQYKVDTSSAIIIKLFKLRNKQKSKKI